MGAICASPSRITSTTASLATTPAIPVAGQLAPADELEPAASRGLPQSCSEAVVRIHLNLSTVSGNICPAHNVAPPPWAIDGEARWPTIGGLAETVNIRVFT
jgi:hypothetical protein